jgi:hypothetical protein
VCVCVCLCVCVCVRVCITYKGTAVNDDGFQAEVFKELQVGDVITLGGVATGKQILVESISDSPAV